ncbi:filamentous hemagglutinin N-terminal domain-containing protein [Calothrix sp. CCY 0018]|uniref:two-partner secretion domain-containing protein n=1 Tax=Calothrix sp. CCY 0018 TaxID=3103864 RepID=UPI0039C5BE3A
MGNKALAQITADDSLGGEKSIVSPVSGQVDLIEGGAARGSNLFHSFQEFNIGEGREANFANLAEIKNIFSRVTGSNASVLLGKLGVSGDANLFFINPNGIFFGENASLDVKGSFVASTASSINFSDNNLFSASNPQAPPPLLTVDVPAPVGLQFEGVPGKITNRSLLINQDTGELIGLGVQPGKTLALVGGDVNIEGGFLRAETGRIELGSIEGNNTVSLTSKDEGIVLGYAGIENFRDISLSQAAYVDTSGGKGGDVQIQGRQITLIEGSQVYLNSFGEAKVGDLTVKASELVKLDGTATIDGFQFPSGFFAEVNDTGNGGTISIATKRLIVENGGSISTSTFGEGKGGNLIVKASESVEALGTSADAQFPSTLFADVYNIGDGGNLIIETQRLTIKDGAQIKASTFAEGSAGNLTVKASESIELEGVVAGTDIPSGLFAQVNEGSSGNAGNLTVETAKLTLLNGAQIASTARNASKGGELNINATNSILVSGSAPNATLLSGRSGIFVSAEPSYINDSGELVPTTGDSGNLLINTGKLTVEEGGTVIADTFGTGKAGELTLNVNELVIRNGGLVRTGSLVEENAVSQERGSAGILRVNAAESVLVSGSGTVGDSLVNSTLFTASEGTGNAGQIFVTTKKMDIQDGGEVTASSSGNNTGGEIELNVNSLTLNNGKIFTTTRSNTGGDINLNIQDLLLLRNESKISTTAGDEQFGGDGGNINVNSPDGFIVAFPNENSDITANAFAGNGGNVDITAFGIFGIEFRDEPTSLSDITASSQLGFDGNVNIETPGIEPNPETVELPEDAQSTEVAQGCQVSGEAAVAFFNIGSGGLPSSPGDTLTSENVIAAWIPLVLEETQVGEKVSRVARGVERKGRVFDCGS